MLIHDVLLMGGIAQNFGCSQLSSRISRTKAGHGENKTKTLWTKERNGPVLSFLTACNMEPQMQHCLQPSKQQDS